MMNRVAILGGGGLLAYSIARLFSKRFAVSLFSHCELDITRVKAYELLEDYNIVINTAAFKNVDECEIDRQNLAYKVNAEGAGNLARYCANSGKMLIHISTDYVFDGEKDGKYSEDEETNPINVYGRSKLEGEKRVIQETDKYIIARVAWLFGKGKLNFVDQLIRKLLNDQTVRLINDKWGNPTYTDSVAEALINLLDKNKRGIFNIVNEGCTTRYDMAVYLKKILDIKSGKIIPISKESIDSPATRPMYTCLSTKKYTEATGAILYDWRDVIKDYINGIL